ncbi:MAG: HEPN domain-containing protein [Thermodesulfovibrionales bacterium]|nr:HEPN domain-containing protein [Thermodesulfovibrionales bacterium]
MTLTIKQKLELSQIRVNRAEEALKEAEYNLKGKMFRTTVNRSYYAVLYAARALLILKGIDPIKHEGVKTMLALEFEKKAIIPKGSVLKIKKIMNQRLTSDYDDPIQVDKNYAEETLSLAKELIEVLKEARQKIIASIEKK